MDQPRRILHGTRLSGHTHRVMLFLHLLGLQHEFADVACYAYIAHAPEGGIDLAPYPQVREWIGRVQALPGFVPMPDA